MKNIQKLASIVLVGMSLLTAAPALAQTATSSQVTADYLLPDSVGSATGLTNTDVRVTVARIIKVAMSLLGIVMVVIMIYGGYLWMTAGGNDEQVGKAKGWIYSGIVGLAIILSAYALANFVINQLVTATGNTPL